MNKLKKEVKEEFTKKEKIFNFSLGVFIILFSIYWTFRDTDLKLAEYKEFPIKISNQPIVELKKMARGGSCRIMYIYSKDYNCTFFC